MADQDIQQAPTLAEDDPQRADFLRMHAFRGSDELDRVSREVLVEQRAFDSTVVGAWHDEHPDRRPMWNASSWDLPTDMHCSGFEDTHPEQPVPAGLSRSQKRTTLLPVKGRSGDVWRAVIEQMNRRPKLAPVWKGMNVDTAVLSVSESMLRRPAIHLPWFDGASGIWIMYTGPGPVASEHLIPVKVSDWFAAVEAEEARLAALGKLPRTVIE